MTDPTRHRDRFRIEELEPRILMSTGPALVAVAAAGNGPGPGSDSIGPQAIEIKVDATGLPAPSGASATYHPPVSDLLGELLASDKGVPGEHPTGIEPTSQVDQTSLSPFGSPAPLADSPLADPPSELAPVRTGNPAAVAATSQPFPVRLSLSAQYHSVSPPRAVGADLSLLTAEMVETLKAANPPPSQRTGHDVPSQSHSTLTLSSTADRTAQTTERGLTTRPTKLSAFSRTGSAAAQSPAAAISWAVDTDGNWDDPSNWSTGVVPTSTDSVLIDRPGVSITVTVRTGSATVGHLVSNETLAVTGGGLTVTGDAVINGSLNQFGGTLNVAGTLQINGDSTWSGGTLSGNVTNQARWTWTGGTKSA